MLCQVRPLTCVFVIRHASKAVALFVLVGCIGAVSSVSASAEQMSSEATDGAVGLLTTLAEQLQPEDAGLASAAVSHLLGATEAVAQTYNGETETEKAAANGAAAQRAKKLGSILERVTVSLSSGLVAGERPAVVETERFKLSAYAGSADEGGTDAGPGAGAGRRRRLLGDSGGASVTLEAGALAGRSASMTQVVEWQGTGPHFWKGPNMTTSRPWASTQQSDTTIGSGVLTVSFFNATGGKVSVSGLTKPAVVGLVVPAHKATAGIRENLEKLSAEELRKRAKGYNVTGVDLPAQTRPELIELLLNVPEIALVASAVYCSYWDTVELTWKVDGAGTFRRAGDTFVADCRTTHFTGMRVVSQSLCLSLYHPIGDPTLI